MHFSNISDKYLISLTTPQKEMIAEIATILSTPEREATIAQVYKVALEHFYDYIKRLEVNDPGLINMLRK